MNSELDEKYDKLKAYLKSLGSLAVAFSGGVDSTFLLAAAKEALGDAVIAITATADFIPQREVAEADDFCKSIGVRQLFTRAEELSDPSFTSNPPDRCYYCKKALFTQMLALAKEEGISHLAEGSNLDDQGDYRPGLRAIEELSVESPLCRIGLTKQEIRKLSRKLSLPTADKPSFACLASRIPYGEEITADKLKRVEAAEQLLADAGFRQFRVRLHGKVARIELLPEDFPRFLEEENRLRIYEAFQKIGFDYTALDLKGYRTGSLNETIAK